MTRPREVEALRARAWSLMGEDPSRAVTVARQALARAPDAESHYVLGVALGALGDGEEAIEAFVQALDLDPEHQDARAELALELFDALRFDEAQEQAATVLRSVPLHPTALWVRGALRERRGDMDGAARDFQAAALGDPERHPLPATLGDDEIESIVSSVLEELHPSLQRYLADVPVILEEVPPEEVLLDLDPPGRPTEVLGCFSGPSLTERSEGGPWSTLPSTISLYRRNLCRLASDPAVLRDELRVTILHEVGHFLGLDEEDLARRGLE